MLFNSLLFIFVFLPFVLFATLQLRGRKILIWLTLMSFFFYSFFGQVWFLFPMLITIVMDFFVAQWLEQSTSQRKKKILLVTSLTCNLGMLCVFKYARFFSQAVSDINTL